MRNAPAAGCVSLCALFRMTGFPILPAAEYGLWFGSDGQGTVVYSAPAGSFLSGVTVNDGLLHVAQHDLPFGGIGPSGMGHYHGYEGFLACSKLRPVFYQARFSALKYFAPPYGTLATRAFEFMAKLKG